MSHTISDAVPAVRTETEAIVTTRRRGRRHRSRSTDRFDTALGWRTDSWISRALRVLATLVILYVFAGPILTVIAGAFDLDPSPTRLTLWPTNPSLRNFEVAGEQGAAAHTSA